MICYPMHLPRINPLIYLTNYLHTCYPPTHVPTIYLPTYLPIFFHLPTTYLPSRSDTIIIWVNQWTRCHQCKESVLVGGPRTFFCLEQTKNWNFPSMDGQTTPNNFEDFWSIFNGQIGKWHTGWRLGCKMFSMKVVHDIYELNLKAQRIIQHIE